MDSRQLQLVLSLNDQMSKELRKISGSLGEVEGSTTKASGAFGGVARSIAAAAAAYVSFQTAYNSLSMGVQVAADLQTAEIGLKTLLGSAEEAAATVDRLKVEAARTPFELTGLTQATQLLTAVTKDGNKSIDVILDIGEGLAAMGKGQGELDRIIVNLQQIAAVGKAATIDIKQFAFAGIPIYEMLAETTGKTGEELNALIEDGGVTFDVLTKMFDEANDAGGRFYNAYVNQAGSFNQANANMKDSFGIMMVDIAKNTGLFDALTKAMMGAADVMMNYKDKIGELKAFYEEHQLAIVMLAGAITAVLIPPLIALTSTLVGMGITAAMAFGAAALAAAPLIIAGAAIAGIAFLIYDNWGGIKEFFAGVWDWVVGKTNEAMSAIGSFFKATWEGIKTIFWGAVNFIIGAYATLLDFLLPGWQGMFTQMYQTVVSVLGTVATWIAEKVGEIWGGMSKWLTTVKDAWMLVWNEIKTFMQGLWDGIVSIFTSAKDSIMSIMDSMVKPIQKIIDMAERAMELGGNFVKGVGKNISGGISSILDRGASITGNRATGGSVAANRMYQVGENGPELFVPQGNGKIVPDYRMSGGGLAGITVNVYGDVTGEDLIDKVERGLSKRIKERVRIA